MKNKIAFGITACGILTFLVGAAGGEAKGQAGYMALGIAAVGLAIAGAGQLISKVANKKEHATLRKYMLSTNDIGNKTYVWSISDEE